MSDRKADILPANARNVTNFKHILRGLRVFLALVFITSFLVWGITELMVDKLVTQLAILALYSGSAAGYILFKIKRLGDLSEYGEE